MRLGRDSTCEEWPRAGLSSKAFKMKGNFSVAAVPGKLGFPGDSALPWCVYITAWPRRLPGFLSVAVVSTRTQRQLERGRAYFAYISSPREAGAGP